MISCIFKNIYIYKRCRCARVSFLSSRLFLWYASQHMNTAIAWVFCPQGDNPSLTMVAPITPGRRHHSLTIAEGDSTSSTGRHHIFLPPRDLSSTNEIECLILNDNYKKYYIMKKWHFCSSRFDIIIMLNLFNTFQYICFLNFQLNYRIQFASKFMPLYWEIKKELIPF